MHKTMIQTVIVCQLLFAQCFLSPLLLALSHRVWHEWWAADILRNAIHGVWMHPTPFTHYSTHHHPLSRRPFITSVPQPWHVWPFHVVLDYILTKSSRQLIKDNNLALQIAQLFDWQKNFVTHE